MFILRACFTKYITELHTGESCCAHVRDETLLEGRDKTNCGTEGTGHEGLRWNHLTQGIAPTNGGVYLLCV
jgi:hypothetical protein